MYRRIVKQKVDKAFLRITKKNPGLMSIINKKIDKIVFDPHRYKNLRAPLQYLKRVHIQNHFVLLFSIDETNKTVILEDFDHHDKIYK